MDRIGVFGGTFDPIHYGHLNAAAQAAVAFELSKIIFVPAGLPWQKAGRAIADSNHRFNMVLIATAANPVFEVSRIEVDQAGPSITADTLRTFAADPAFSNAEFFFITGADALSSLSTWREYPELLDLATFVGVTRPGHDLPEESDTTATIRLLEVPGMDISSTALRERFATGGSVDYLTPGSVSAYALKHSLFGTRDDAGQNG